MWDFPSSKSATSSKMHKNLNSETQRSFRNHELAIQDGPRSTGFRFFISSRLQLADLLFCCFHTQTLSVLLVSNTANNDSAFPSRHVVHLILKASKHLLYFHLFALLNKYYIIVYCSFFLNDKHINTRHPHTH